MITLEVETHSGKKLLIDVAEYDPIALNDKINSTELITITIGDVILSRIDVKYIAKLETPKTF